MWQEKEPASLINIADITKAKVAKRRTRSVNVITARDFTTTKFYKQTKKGYPNKTTIQRNLNLHDSGTHSSARETIVKLIIFKPFVEIF